MTARQLPTNVQLEMMAKQHISWEALCLLDSLGYRGHPHISTRMGIGELWAYKKEFPAVRKAFNHPLGMHDAMIHTRVIASFLKCKSPCTDGRHKHDIEASHYINNWRGLNTLESEKNWEILNRSVAHLSLERLRLPVMPIAERRRLAINTLKGLSAFIKELPEARAGWFDDISEALKSVNL